MSSSPTPDFGPLAAAYDALRPADEHWLEVVDALVDEASLLGCRLLDVGCGTGKALVELRRRGADVAGVEPSAEMLAVARASAPGARLEQGTAERLPFADASFDRLVYSLVVHLVDRPRAFAEARRVLAPGGAVAILTFEPIHFDCYFLNRFFPSIARIDRERFPTPAQLEAELRDAGFEQPRLVPLHQAVTVSRAEALRRIRGRHISTFHLLDEAEYRNGLARAETELPDPVETTRDWLIAVAERQ